MSEAVDPVALLEPAAARVRDPHSGKSVLLANIVRNARMDDTRLRFDLAFTPAHTKEERKAIEEAILLNLRELGFHGQVFPFSRLDGTAPTPPKPKADIPGLHHAGGVAPHGGAIVKMKLEGVQHVVCVASGKGGVGKSTVAANLAIALQREGKKVGLMDADVYGPSVPLMMNVRSQPFVDEKNRIIPVNAYGVRCLSAGLLVPDDQAIIWRGPMVMNLLRQFLQQAAWRDIEYLVVDLPPGTGDAQLSIIQAVEIAGAIVVSTPQDVALADAVRGISMFKKLEVPILGVVENMAWYELPDGTRDYVFGEGGAVRLAEREGTEVLGQIPLQTSLRRSGDQGLPAALGEDAIAGAFRGIARRIVEKLPVVA